MATDQADAGWRWQGLREATEPGDRDVDVAVLVGGARRGAEAHLRPQGGLRPVPAQPPPAEVIGEAKVGAPRVGPYWRRS
jgi:hypothetical protein